jgi:transcriptional regulator with XRE-family HTH domain
MIHVKNSKTLGRLARLVRRHQGIEQEDFAAICGFSRTPIKSFEKGEGSISLNKVLHVLDELGIEMTLSLPGDLSDEQKTNIITRLQTELAVPNKVKS